MAHAHEYLNDEEWIFLRRLFNQHPRLSAEQELSLLRICEDSDAEEEIRKKAKEKIVLSNLQLGFYLAQDYKIRYPVRTLEFTLMELFDETYIALKTSIDNFSLGKIRTTREESFFGAYASVAIRRHLWRVTSTNQFRIPRGVFAQCRQIQNVVNSRFVLTGERIPEESVIQKIFKKSKVNLRGIRRALMIHARRPASLKSYHCRQVQEPDDNDLSEPVLRAGLEDFVRRTLCNHPRHADIICYRFGLSDNEPRTFAQIGKMYGVKRQSIEQIANKALKRLTRNCQKLKGGLD
jgi:DNA-directed RNA polymerase sigma subunit (sigma70/sigma32)